MSACRFDAQLLRDLVEGRLTGDKWLLGGSTAALRWCALLSSSIMMTTTTPLDRRGGMEAEDTTQGSLSCAETVSGGEMQKDGEAEEGSNRGCTSEAESDQECDGEGVNLTEKLKQHFLDMVYRKGDSPSTLAPMM